MNFACLRTHTTVARRGLKILAFPEKLAILQLLEQQLLLDISSDSYCRTRYWRQHESRGFGSLPSTYLPQVQCLAYWSEFACPRLDEMVGQYMGPPVILRTFEE